MNSFIKSLMEEKGLKQKELAEILGISPSAVSQWDEGGTNITADNLYYLSKLFHVTVDELLEGKRTDESLEDKWKREYDINEKTAEIAQYFGDKVSLLQCLETVTKANNRFFILLEKKIKDKITEKEIKEFEYLKQFYQIKMRNNLFNNVQITKNHENNITIIDFIKAKMGEENYAAILWELKNTCKIIDFGIDQSILDDFDDDVFYAWYNILTPIEKDRIINAEFNGSKDKCQRIDYLNELIKRGGNILYTPRDLNLINYNYKDLNAFEGEVKPVPELDNAQAVIFRIYDNYSIATYEQYQALINFPRMRQIEMEAKFKGKNPIKYWEYIKNNEVLI